MEAASVGLPFEVWKTHMGTYRSQGTMEAFRNIYRSGGVLAFYRGLQPKLFESFFKGGILLFAKEAIIKNCKGVGMGDVTAGLIGGFGGGVAQVSNYTAFFFFPFYKKVGNMTQRTALLLTC